MAADTRSHNLPSEQDGLFQRLADRVSYAMGTPANIAVWVVFVGVWFALFSLGILRDNTSFMPAWFTSNAFNFPLNTVTTLAELYLAFLVAAATNRSERSLRRLIEQTSATVNRIERMTEQQRVLLDTIAAMQEEALAWEKELQQRHGEPVGD